VAAEADTQVDADAEAGTAIPSRAATPDRTSKNRRTAGAPKLGRVGAVSPLTRRAGER